MEYKPPLEKQKSYRFYDCKLGIDNLWRCEKCQDKQDACNFLNEYKFQEKIKIEKEVPEFFDSWTIRKCLGVSKFDM
jgi:hypothetical protein